MDFDLENYDFIELRVYDIHGFTKARLISRSAFPKVIKDGMGLCGVLCFMGIKSQTNMHPQLWDAMKFANYRAKPLIETLKPCQRIVQGKHRVATVLCELRFNDGTVETSAPREATLALLKQLDEEFGLKIRSSFEVEFGLRETKTQTLFENNSRWCSAVVLQCAQEVLIDMVKSVGEIDVKIDTIMPENGPGQYEVTFDITEGIEAADMVADFKTAAYVHLRKNGYHIEFMACVKPTLQNHNGFHYNFSLWDSEGHNVLVNPENPEQLSEFGRHWLAGLVEHCPALLALCSPTVNCYRRVGHGHAPTYVNWGPEDRSATFRVKIEPEGNVYIENRLPSSACSPHLVLASTLAAGMDGVRRKLTLPPPMDTKKKLPGTLVESLAALEADTLLKAALTPKLVELFIYTKRVFELEPLEAFCELSDEEMLRKEVEHYYDNC